MSEKFIGLLKKNQLSVTPVRLALLDTIEHNPHSDADNLFNQVKKTIVTTSVQAVYDNLNILNKVGLVKMIKPRGHSALYETRVTGNHHHVICRNCGSINDVECKTLQQPCLHFDADKGYEIDEAEITFWGICPNCKSS